MTVYVVRDGQVVPKSEAAPLERPEIQALEAVHLASSSLPLNWSVPDPDHPGRRVKLAPNYDKMGRPLFESMKEIREAVAKATDLGETVAYSRGFHNYGA